MISFGHFSQVEKLEAWGWGGGVGEGNALPPMPLISDLARSTLIITKNKQQKMQNQNK